VEPANPVAVKKKVRKKEKKHEAEGKEKKYPKGAILLPGGLENDLRYHKKKRKRRESGGHINRYYLRIAKKVRDKSGGEGKRKNGGVKWEY